MSPFRANKTQANICLDRLSAASLEAAQVCIAPECISDGTYSATYASGSCSIVGVRAEHEISLTIRIGVHIQGAVVITHQHQRK